MQRDVFLIKRRQITLRRQDTGDPTERSDRRQTTGYNIDSFDVERGIRTIAMGFPKRDLGRIIFAIIPDSAVEISWGRLCGWNWSEKRDRGNDIVGMSCRLIHYRPFQLRRNWKSL